MTAPIAENSVVGKITYEIDGETYSSDLLANNEVIASNFETIIFRILLIFLILYLLIVILRKINRPKKSARGYNSKYHSSSKKKKSKKGGRYKFTQIHDYL